VSNSNPLCLFDQPNPEKEFTQEELHEIRGSGIDWEPKIQFSFSSLRQNEELQNMIQTIRDGGNWFMVPRCFTKIMSIEASFVLGSLINLGANKSTKEGWIVCTREFLKDELNITKHTQNRIFKELQRLGLISIRMDKAHHFRLIHIDVLKIFERLEELGLAVIEDEARPQTRMSLAANADEAATNSTIEADNLVRKPGRANDHHDRKPGRGSSANQDELTTTTTANPDEARPQTRPLLSIREEVKNEEKGKGGGKVAPSPSSFSHLSDKPKQPASNDPSSEEAEKRKEASPSSLSSLSELASRMSEIRQRFGIPEPLDMDWNSIVAKLDRAAAKRPDLFALPEEVETSTPPLTAKQMWDMLPNTKYLETGELPEEEQMPEPEYGPPRYQKKERPYVDVDGIVGKVFKKNGELRHPKRE
jgi:hypothetical protein